MTYLDVNDPYFSPNTCRNQPVGHAKAKMLDMLKQTGRYNVW